MISIIIVTYNTGALIRECLSHLAAQTDGLEMIVVDNASQDGTPDLIAAEFPDVVLVRNQANVGFGAANNQGFKLAKGDYFILVNPDLIVDREAIKRMVDYLKNHSRVGMVGPRTLSGEGTPEITARPPYTAWRVLAKHLSLNLLFPALTYGDYPQRIKTEREPFPVAWLQGSCLAMPRAVCEQINGFDAGFFLNVEDVDLCERVAAAGWQVMFLPDVTVKHYGSTSMSRFTIIRVRSFHLSPLYYFRKRNQRGAVWLLKIGFAVELLLKIGIRGLRWRRNIEQISAEWQVLRETWQY